MKSMVVIALGRSIAGTVANHYLQRCIGLPIPLAGGFVNGYPAADVARFPGSEIKKQKS
jgi:hypothetical protein